MPKQAAEQLNIVAYAFAAAVRALKGWKTTTVPEKARATLKASKSLALLVGSATRQETLSSSGIVVAR